MSNEIILSDKKILFDNKDGLVEAWLYMSNALARAKELKAKLDQYIIEHFQENDLQSIEIDKKWILKVGNKKKERFKTEEIYDLFGFSSIQRQILCKNPDFRKTALKLEMGEDDMGEVIDTKYEDKIEVKEINTEIIKQKEIGNGTGTSNS